MKFNLLIPFLLLILVACSNTKTYQAVFIGESEHWKGVLVQDGKVTYRNHPELENQFEIEYQKDETLTITFLGDVNELGNEVEFSYRSKLGGSGSSTKSDDGLTNKVFSASGGSTGVSHIRKDMEYNPINRSDKDIEVLVKWEGKEEIIKLKYNED